MPSSIGRPRSAASFTPPGEVQATTTGGPATGRPVTVSSSPRPSSSWRWRGKRTVPVCSPRPSQLLRGGRRTGSVARGTTATSGKANWGPSAPTREPRSQRSSRSSRSGKPFSKAPTPSPNTSRSIHGPPRPTPSVKRPPEVRCSSAACSPRATGWRVESTLTAVPTPIRRVRPSSSAASVAASGQTPYGTKWCSASQTLSRPACSASTADRTVRSSASPWLCPGNCADSRNRPTRTGAVFAGRAAVRWAAGSGSPATAVTGGTELSAGPGAGGRTPTGRRVSARALVLVILGPPRVRAGSAGPASPPVGIRCHVPMAR